MHKERIEERHFPTSYTRRLAHVDKRRLDILPKLVVVLKEVPALKFKGRCC
jgi:hypothetical protein